MDSYAELVQYRSLAALLTADPGLMEQLECLAPHQSASIPDLTPRRWLVTVQWLRDNEVAVAVAADDDARDLLHWLGGHPLVSPATTFGDISPRMPQLHAALLVTGRLAAVGLELVSLEDGTGKSTYVLLPAAQIPLFRFLVSQVKGAIEPLTLAEASLYGPVPRGAREPASTAAISAMGFQEQVVDPPPDPAEPVWYVLRRRAWWLVALGIVLSLSSHFLHGWVARLIREGDTDITAIAAMVLIPTFLLVVWIRTLIRRRRFRVRLTRAASVPGAVVVMGHSRPKTMQALGAVRDCLADGGDSGPLGSAYVVAVSRDGLRLIPGYREPSEGFLIDATQIRSIHTVRSKGGELNIAFDIVSDDGQRIVPVSFLVSRKPMLLVRTPRRFVQSTAAEMRVQLGLNPLE
ncbi:hypothetical protein GCM10010401_00280 [Rarobacter faecitabidus]|uniref:Uncharacterized protein n=1 Tax=Rarobacter faecitabidus TaxID=13243 RepID=A0A542ZWU8_RARFA|nr:hypothetical protein [Rarobacter faecitabidus]TQL64831.1 hypothetical protein FB461_1354 [Rarobacter faecitabidus]